MTYYITEIFICHEISDKFSCKLTEYLDARDYLLVGGSAVIETEGLRGSLCVAVEGRAWNYPNVSRRRRFDKGISVNTLGKSAPNKESSLGAREFDALWHIALKTLEHKIALVPVYLAYLLNMPLKITLGHILIAEYLEEQICVNVARLL